MVGDQGNLSLNRWVILYIPFFLIVEHTLRILQYRLIQSARVIDNQICYDIKDANQIHEICYTRFRLHKMIYNHKTGTYTHSQTARNIMLTLITGFPLAKAIEYMIIDALLLADPHMDIAKRVDQPEKYLHLTDAIMLEIEASERPVSSHYPPLIS